MTTKREIRAEARSRLRSLPNEERAVAEEEIARRVWTVPEVAAARTLLLFADLPEEVSTDAIASEALHAGIAIVYPRVQVDTRTMTLHRVTAADQLAPASYGIREPDPARTALVDPAEIEAVLVPGLAWDRRGGRLGRGAGYYDRLFAHEAWRGFRCGVFFAFQEVPAVPTEPWDIPLHAVVTDREVWRGD
ncbi:MAG TPA: 5-formyltetrahydrofolate cyclo-ligase [Longimicrobium sp.]|nr:5-formyltetrahydrofolate cyclo-ligase [Longimicrobium sp.]